GVWRRMQSRTEKRTDVKPPDIAKPGHAVLLAISLLVLVKTALAGTLISALSGIGTVAATYALGLHGWGPRVAIPAAVLLAVSGQHLVYSREALVEADGLFFATLAALMYLKARSPRGLVAAGVLFGVSFSCNNRIVYLPAVLLVAECVRWGGWRTLIRRGAILAAGFAVPLALIEAAYLAIRAVGNSTNARMDWLDYAQQLVTFYRMNAP